MFQEKIFFKLVIQNSWLKIPTGTFKKRDKISFQSSYEIHIIFIASLHSHHIHQFRCTSIFH